ncbi:MAG: calcium-binding protein [Acidimicrobiales bacterium]
MSPRSGGTALLIGAVVTVAAIAPSSPATAGTPGPRDLISTAGPDGGNGASSAPQASADGRVVAYVSTANNLGVADSGLDADVYRRDRLTNTTALVSVNQAGTDGGNGPSSGPPAVNASGRFIAFASLASNLVATLDTNSVSDVYWRDTALGITQLVSVNGTTTAAGNDSSTSPSISADGCVVAFQSRANNLLPAGPLADAGFDSDVYSRDMCANGPNQLVSVNGANTDGGNGPSSQLRISADGRHVAFDTSAFDLGAADFGSTLDVYRRDLWLGTTELVSVTPANTSGNQASWLVDVSAHGDVVAFTSLASNLGPTDTNFNTDAYVRNLATGDTEMVSANGANTDSANGSSAGNALSGDGRYVAFHSNATNIDPADTISFTDVYRRDLFALSTVLVSVSTAGAGGSAPSQLSVMSDDGRFVVFTSTATDLVTPPSNGLPQVFVRDLVWGDTTLISTAGAGVPGNATSGSLDPPAVSADGRVVAFVTKASNLGPPDAGTDDDVYAALTAACTITGTPGNDVLEGTGGRDVVCGQAGSDRLRGVGGDDILDGGLGNDYLDGGPGHDSLAGGEGNDTLIGGPGVDSMFGFSAPDLLYAVDAVVVNDYMDGGLASDNCQGDSGDSRILCL